MRRARLLATSQLLVTRKPTRPSGHRRSPNRDDVVATRAIHREAVLRNSPGATPGPRQGALGTHGAGLRAVGRQHEANRSNQHLELPQPPDSEDERFG